MLPEAVLTGGGPGARDTHAGGGGAELRTAPLEALFDVEQLLDWWASVGAVLHRVRRANVSGQGQLRHGLMCELDAVVGRANCDGRSLQ